MKILKQYNSGVGNFKNEINELDSKAEPLNSETLNGNFENKIDKVISKAELSEFGATSGILPKNNSANFRAEYLRLYRKVTKNTTSQLVKYSGMLTYKLLSELYPNNPVSDFQILQIHNNMKATLIYEKDKMFPNQNKDLAPFYYKILKAISVTKVYVEEKGFKLYAPTSFTSMEKLQKDTLVQIGSKEIVRKKGEWVYRKGCLRVVLDEWFVEDTHQMKMKRKAEGRRSAITIAGNKVDTFVKLATTWLMGQSDLDNQKYIEQTIAQYRMKLEVLLSKLDLNAELKSGFVNDFLTRTLAF